MNYFEGTEKVVKMIAKIVDDMLDELHDAKAQDQKRLHLQKRVPPRSTSVNMRSLFRNSLMLKKTMQALLSS